MTQSPPLPSLLYIDRDPVISRLVERDLNGAHVRISLASSEAEAASLLRAGRFDVIALDLSEKRQLPRLFEMLPGASDPATVLCLVPGDDVALALAALQAGAIEVLIKDKEGKFIDQLGARARVAIDQARLRREREGSEQAMRESLAKLEQLNAKQAVLLREMNHRIGNSLQLIISMIRMQATSTKNAEARQVLQQAIERVIAVSQVHQRLYSMDDAQYVQMRPYISQILGDHKVAAEMQNCSLSIDIENCRLETDRAIALGIIATELVTNALRHAYPKKGGPVRISLSECDGDSYRLVVEDEGIGMTGAFRPSTIGARIVDGMAKRLKSQIILEPTETGARLVLRFPRSADIQEPAS